MNFELTPAVILTFVFGYFAILLLISWWTSRHADEQSFFIGNKKSKWYLVAFGMIGASLSGVTFISIPGVVGNLDFGNANRAFSYMQMVFGYLVGYAIIATILMPLYYRLNLTSIYTYLEQRFGTTSYKTGAGFFILSRVIGASFRLYLVAIVLQQFVFDPWGVPFWVTVLMTLILIWIYTHRGGIKTIVWTDTLQTLFMLLAVGLSLYFIGNSLGLNFGGMVETLKASDYSQIFHWDSKPKSFFWKQFLSGAGIAVVMTGLDQDMMQKNNSCENIGDAQKNMFWFSIILVFVNLLFLSLGAFLYMYATQNGIEIPTKTDQLFPTIAIDHLPTIAGIVFLIGLLAAAYSSADSALTALTTSFCVDFLGFEKEKFTTFGRLSKKQTRFAVHVGFSLVLFLVIVLFNSLTDKSVINKLFQIAGYTYGPLLGLFTFGLIMKRAIKDKWAILVCILAPTICFTLFTLMEIQELKEPTEHFLYSWLGKTRFENLANFSRNTFKGYTLGFELLLYNGLLTFIGLWLISKSSKKQLR